MRETKIEKRLVCEVERIGGKCPKWVSPGNRGVPDRIVILPSGVIAFAETKAPGKPLEPLQARWARILRNLGFPVYKLDSYEDIDKFILEVSQASAI